MARKMLLPIILLPPVFWMSLTDAQAAETPQTRGIMDPGQCQVDLRAYLLERAPSFVTPSDSDQWAEKADSLRQRILDEVIYKGVPDEWRSGPVKVVWQDTLPGKGYVIRKLRYEAIPGLWVGALLYEPENLTGFRPAVLNTNGHVGKPGMTIDYKQIRCINLAKRGMLALSIEFFGMGQLSKPVNVHNEGAYLDLCGRTTVSVLYQCMKRGLDILCSHPSADKDRIAMTGLSGGGWQTIVLSALDPRIKLAAPNAGYIGFLSRVLYIRDPGDLEQNPADFLKIADYPDLTALLYPRPALLIYNATDECCFRADQAWHAVYRPIAPMYEQASLADRFAFHMNHDPGTHNYDLDNRQAFYRFLNRHFLPESEQVDEEIPCDDEVRKSEELAIEYPANNHTLHTLAVEAMKSLPSDKRPADDKASLDQWRRRMRPRLLSIVRPDAPLNVAERPACASDDFRVAEGLPAEFYHLRLGDQWTLPAVEYTPASDPAGMTLILSDQGCSKERDAVQAVLNKNRWAVAVDLLFAGECKPLEGTVGQMAMMLSALGRRSLGVQVAQLVDVVDHLQRKYPDESLQLLAVGRVQGLAALTWAALNPGVAESIQLKGMDQSLKDMLSKKVIFNSEPSVFCFGLLEVADIQDLIDLALPSKVEIVAGKE